MKRQSIDQTGNGVVQALVPVLGNVVLHPG